MVGAEVMTTDQLIELLKQHPGKEVATTSGSDYCEADRVDIIELVPRVGWLSPPAPLPTDEQRKVWVNADWQRIIKRAEDDQIAKKEYVYIG
jgi:hypothetical protein